MERTWPELENLRKRLLLHESVLKVLIEEGLTDKSRLRDYRFAIQPQLDAEVRRHDGMVCEQCLKPFGQTMKPHCEYCGSCNHVSGYVSQTEHHFSRANEKLEKKFTINGYPLKRN